MKSFSGETKNKTVLEITAQKRTHFVKILLLLVNNLANKHVEKGVKIDRLVNGLVYFKEISTDFMLIKKVMKCMNQGRLDWVETFPKSQSFNVIKVYFTLT